MVLRFGLTVCEKKVGSADRRSAESPADKIDGIKTQDNDWWISLSLARSLSLSLALLFAILVPMVSRCLEAWRRLRAEYDPTPSMRRVAILGRLGLVQNPPHCKSVGELGGALEQWLSLKRQHEVFTDRDGNPIKSSV